MSLSIRRRSSKFINVTIWEHCTFDSQIFGCGKFTTLTALLISSKLSFPVGLKMSPLPTLALKPPNKVFVRYLGILWNACSSSS
jgi:hypothetical protein